MALNQEHELTICKTLTNWSEKRKVALDLVANDGNSSSSMSILQQNVSGENGSSSSTNMIHSVPGGSGYV